MIEAPPLMSSGAADFRSADTHSPTVVATTVTRLLDRVPAEFRLKRRPRVFGAEEMTLPDTATLALRKRLPGGMVMGCVTTAVNAVGTVMNGVLIEGTETVPTKATVAVAGAERPLRFPERSTAWMR